MRFDPSLLPTGVPDDVYDPREDSLLLLDAIELAPQWRTALEVGCGSALASLHLAKAGLSVVAVDVNPSAVRYADGLARRLGLAIDARVSDLFSGVGNRYDLLAFNPPYLPADMSDKRLTREEMAALVGGGEGFELALRFAREAGDHMSPGGAAYLLVLEVHARQFLGEGHSLRWAVARKADFDGERLAVLRASHK